MPDLPRAMLIDLDDTIISAFGQSENQWQRVIAEYVERLHPHEPERIIAAIQTYSTYLWEDQARHKDWRHRIGEARRHIVESAFAELAAAGGPAAPEQALTHLIVDHFIEVHDAELRMFPGA